jgi:SAM-dependent methyltransferase
MLWYEDDKLWEKFYDCMFDRASFELAQQQVSQLLALVKHPLDSVVDMACGPGRHCLALAKMGFDVEGVDISRFLLSKALDHNNQNHLNIRFTQADMLDYKPQEPVDLIINMFNSFGYFDTAEKNQLFINNCYANLKQTGSLIIDTVGKETLARTIEPVHLTEYSNGDIRIERPLLVDNMQVFSNEWLLIRDDRVFRRSYQHYVYTAVELQNMCLQAGFKHVEIYGSLQGDDYDLEADRLVIVAEKT